MDLMQKIADVVGQHYPCPCGKDRDGFPHCCCGWYDDTHEKLWREHVAELVVDRLGLVAT